MFLYAIALSFINGLFAHLLTSDYAFCLWLIASFDPIGHPFWLVVAAKWPFCLCRFFSRSLFYLHIQASLFLLTRVDSLFFHSSLTTSYYELGFTLKISLTLTVPTLFFYLNTCLAQVDWRHPEMQSDCTVKRWMDRLNLQPRFLWLWVFSPPRASFPFSSSLWSSLEWKSRLNSVGILYIAYSTMLNLRSMQGVQCVFAPQVGSGVRPKTRLHGRRPHIPSSIQFCVGTLSTLVLLGTASRQGSSPLVRSAFPSTARHTQNSGMHPPDPRPSSMSNTDTL